MMKRCPNCNGSIIRVGHKEKPFLCPSCNEWFSNEEVTPKLMLDLEEYNAVFDCNLSKDAFDVIMGTPIKIRDADELIFVDPDTKEKIVFRRVSNEV